jgi:hypothetical protein
MAANATNNGNQNGAPLPLTPKNGGVRILGKRFQDWVINKINGNDIIKVVCPQTDGTNILPPKFADIKSTPLGKIITLPPAGATLGSGATAGTLWPWMYPTHVEGDPSQSYSKGMTMYLSALNPLVVTGLVDRVSGATLTACQGIWLAMDNVAPVGGDGKWDMPQFPYPNAAATLGGAAVEPGTVAPSGTPLKGDWDTMNPADGSIYPKWRYLGDVPTP